MTNFRIHPHRVNFGTELPKQYVHVDAWGAEPREFYDVIVNVPCQTVYDPAGCGCPSHVAQAWMEGKVDEAELDWSDDGRVLTIGKAPKKKAR